ncbi:hypothetical protein Sjap_017720 [Stephania japonica]|uniref:GED domain-containing protein n=1 Tax=Stephania japonica TaxID=461633 RepID=A0AAP0NKR6_9MAGN
MEVFVKVIGSPKVIGQLLLRGEYDEFLDDKTMHCPARIIELLGDRLPPEAALSRRENMTSSRSSFATKAAWLRSEESSKNTLFLMEEIAVLEESSQLALPNFLPRSAFRTILKQKLKGVAQTPFEFSRKVWNYIEGVVMRILAGHSESYPQLQTSCRRAAYNLITKMREQSYSYVQEMVQMETIADYMSNPEYMNTWHDLMKYQEPLLQILNGNSFNTQLEIPGFDRMEVLHLKVLLKKVEQAFDMKMRVTAYWKIFMLRLVDNLALHLFISMKNLVNEEMETEVVKEFMGGNGGS